MGLQLGEAQSPCLGPSFFLPSTRKKSAQSSGSEGACITAVGTGVILDVPRGAKTLSASNNRFKWILLEG